MIEAQPNKSDRAIAADIGVSDKAIAKARKATAENSAVGKCIGRDGKARKLPIKKSLAVDDRAADFRLGLSLSAQQKFDAAMWQHKKKLAQEFEQRVQDEVHRRIDEIVLPHWQKQIDEAKCLYGRRKAFMSKETFNTIRRALHPDSRGSISDNKLGEAFDTFVGLEKYLLNEKDGPTTFPDLPSSLAEWDKMRAKKPRRGVANPVQRRRT